MTQKQTEKDLPIDTPTEEADAQQAAVDAHRVHCEECVWWTGADGADKGKCHRHAPRPGTINWATTGRTDFCGDAKPKPGRAIKMKINRQTPM